MDSLTTVVLENLAALDKVGLFVLAVGITVVVATWAYRELF
jgi:hypothetical protein